MRHGELLTDLVFESEAQSLALPVVSHQLSFSSVLSAFGLAESVHQYAVPVTWHSLLAFQKDEEKRSMLVTAKFSPRSHASKGQAGYGLRS